MIRKSIRKYADRPVSDELLNDLLQQAERTQTMGNLQLYSVVVTRSEAKKKELAPAHFNQPMVTQAPVVLTFCADYHRTTEWPCSARDIPATITSCPIKMRQPMRCSSASVFAIWPSSRFGTLLFRHHHLSACRYHRCTALAQTRYAHSNDYLGLAR